MPKVFKMKDISDNFTIKKDDIPSLPMRMLAIGRTGCGKSSIALGNLLLRDEFYRKDFLPENIFIFSGSLSGDIKLRTIIDNLDIPSSNLFDTYDQESANDIYDMLVENFNEKINDKMKPEHSLIIFDDLGFTNLQKTNKKNNILDKILCNGRKFLISTITLNQKLTQLNTNAREQCSAVMLWKSTKKQVDLAESTFNYLDNRNAFFELVRKNTIGQHDFIVMDFQKPEIYRDMNFNPIPNLPY
tara:strand:+ start:1008 stop:1739 length:732 start_codon:yes stop_codon:yes gene_type:complete